MDVFLCICAHGDQRKIWSPFLNHSQHYWFRQGPSLNLEFTDWTDRLSKEIQEANYFHSSQSWACKCISPTIPCFYVVARDTNLCLQSKHFTQRAISSASPCFVNMYSYLWKFKQFFSTIICSNFFSPSFLLGVCCYSYVDLPNTVLYPQGHLPWTALSFCFVFQVRFIL